ncbi:MAG: class I SAM-dependent methyltransferase [Verrucomicrobiales bacterium]|nr:class I SAM-dependent methyltransferase [Verrucomicrobiales bacterium]
MRTAAASAIAVLFAVCLAFYWLRHSASDRPAGASAVPAVPATVPAEPPPVAAPGTKPPAPSPVPTPAPPAPEVEPPALTEYKGRVIAQTMHWKGAPWLQRKTREEEERGGLMRTQLEVKPGQTACDLGSGDGYHTLWLAAQVGETGRVYAVDIQQEMLDMLEKRAAAAGLKNIELVHGRLWDPLLPPNSQDLILLVDVYHEFSHPEHMLRALRTALKEHGRMVLVEFRSEDPKVPIKPEHKMSKEQILQEIPPMGFKLVKEFDGLPWQHLMFFERADPASAAP